MDQLTAQERKSALTHQFWLTFIPAIALVWVGVSGLLSFFVLETRWAIDGAHYARVEALKLADQLEQTSDDQTRMARLYTVTGDQRYRDHFESILDIRNGATPRPADYDEVYWDVVLAGESDATERDETTIALLDHLDRIGLTNEEKALIQDSIDSFNELAELELLAMEAAADSQFAEAQQQLHGAIYHQRKLDAVLPIKQFRDTVSHRTSSRLQKLFPRRSWLDVWAQAFIALAAITLAIGIFVSTKSPVLNSLLDSE